MKMNKLLTTASIGCANLLTSMAMASITAAPVTLPSQVNDLVGQILGYAKAAGLIVAIGMLTFAGFKYLTAGAGEKAKAKDMFVPLAIGAALVILAPFIGDAIWTSLSGAGTASGT
jgi:hypothetical protein